MVANEKGLKLIVCPQEAFILPIYESALSETKGNIKHIKKRYKNALLLDQHNNIFQITNIFVSDRYKRTLADFVFQRQPIGVEIKPLNCEFNDYLNQLVKASLNGDGYSVWAQFYDGKEELREALLKCKTLIDVFRVLHIHGDGELSPYLV